MVVHQERGLFEILKIKILIMQAVFRLTAHNPLNIYQWSFEQFPQVIPNYYPDLP